MRAVTLRTGLGFAIVAAALAWTADARAQVTITQDPERPSLLYSADGTQDCSALHATADLPYNVVRLTAEAAGADGYRWSLPKPQIGFLLADQDLGPGETDAAVRGLCGEFGNACILTDKTLRLYKEATVLYAAPTCDVLPTRTNKPFDGGSVKIKVKAMNGSKKIGTATTTVVYGDPTVAHVTLYAFGQNGIGKQQAVDGGIQTQFNAIPTPAVPPNGPVTAYEFAWAGDSETKATCDSDPTLPCVTLEEPLAGTFLATVKARLADGSALCDNVNVHVGACHHRAQVQVIRVPTKRTYVSKDLVSLRVRFANLSKEAGCSLVLKGGNVLSCTATFRLGATEETKVTQWDFRHCSATTTQPCSADSECPATEQCLTTSHCSQTLDRPCDGDSDCQRPICTDCEDNERCIRVLAIEEQIVAPGQALDLVGDGESIEVLNTIGDPVTVKETWTANAFPVTTASTMIKYRIKGQ